MLNRRLLILFILFTLGFAILAFRLANLQITNASHWQNELRQAAHSYEKIESSRGAILDRYGLPLARDVVCDDLAIDYRAMNLDDKWLTSAALARIRNEKFADREQKKIRVNQTKAAIADQIDSLPDVIAKACNIPKEDVLQRFQEIRERIRALHEDYWSRRYIRQHPGGPPTDTTPDDADDPLDTNFQQTTIRDQHAVHTIVHNLPTPIANFFRQHLDDYPGLYVLDNANTRAYGPPPDPAHPTAPSDPSYAESVAQLVGTLRSINADVIADPSKKFSKFDYPDLLNNTDNGNLVGYLPGDDVGESGAEKILEPLLHGTRGVRLTERGTVGGGGTANDNSTDKQINPTPGKDVRLTLDLSLQHDLYNNLLNPSNRLLFGQDPKFPDQRPVALVILSLDGQVLSMITLPTYDPNNIDALRPQLNADAVNRPLANRALESYQPGSTVKPLLASAALTEGVINPQTTIVCNGYLFPNNPRAFRCSIYVETNGRVSHGPLELVEAIAQSCNIYFYTAGGKLGIDRLSKWFDLYGLGRDTGFELPDTNGFIPKPKSADTDPDEIRNDSLFLGIGQGPVNASPLQMANAYATLLRGGLNISPRLLLDAAPKPEQRFTLDPQILATVKEGMRAVITRGTAKDVFPNFKLPILGKTGTADTSRPAFDPDGKPLYDTSRPLLNPDNSPRLGPDQKPLYRPASNSGTDAWFIACAPADQPKFIIAAVMEFGGYGGKAAAPIVKQALLQLEKHNYLPAMDIPN